MPKSHLSLVPKEQAQPRQIPNNLPAQPTRLIGRERDVTSTLALITSDDINLLTLVGPGGVGKTRLSLQLAEELLDEFEDGVYFIELAHITYPDLVTQAIARALELQEGPGIPLLSTLKDYLEGKKVLLVLDNFEQVIPAGRDVSELLSSCRDLKLIITSRSPLKLRSERLFTVSPLSLPEKRHTSTVNTLLQYGAIALFTVRAKAVKSDFELTDSNSSAVSEICRKVDGIPLGIELVAAYVDLLTPQSLLSRLTSPLRMMTAGALDAPVRHQTMRDTIEWSYNLLTEDEQILFRSLAVFVGGFTLGAVESVCRTAGGLTTEKDDFVAINVSKGLKSLIDKSLLRRIEQSEDPDPRLAMLETVREFAEEQLFASGEAETLQKRHASYYFSLSELAKGDQGRQESLARLVELQPDQENFRAALNWFMEGKETGSDALALQMLQHLQLFLERRIQPSEFLAWLEKGLAQARPDNPLRVWARRRGCVQAMRQGDLPRAQFWAEEALRLATETEDNLQITEARTMLANVKYMQKDYITSSSLWEQSLAVYRKLGKHFQIGGTLLNLATSAFYLGDYQRAEKLSRESLEIFRRADETSNMPWSLLSLGQALRHLGKFPQAKEVLLEALAMSQETQTVWLVADALAHLGRTLLDEGDRTAKISTWELRKITRLCGLSAGLLSRRGMTLEKPRQDEFDDTLATLRGRLPEAVFSAAWNEGYASTLDQALQLAIEEPESEAKSTQNRASNQPTGGLTRRENEIANLVARGLTSAEVARQLFLSERTVEMHVANAMQKLNLHRRTELVAWINRQKLTGD